MFNIFFNGNFEKLINKLEIPAFYNAVTITDLHEVRDYSKTILKESANESATRAFCNLILLNRLIPIESRVVQGLKMRSVFKIWHMVDAKLNLDLYLKVTEAIDQLVLDYAGKEYSEEYFNVLQNKLGLIFPIKHDHLLLLTMINLYKGKKLEKTPLAATWDLYVNEILVDTKTYLKHFTPEGQNAMVTFAKEFTTQ